nr:serine/threonine-protein kinase-like protein At3g51990 [Penaeus vannamei]
MQGGERESEETENVRRRRGRGDFVRDVRRARRPSGRGEPVPGLVDEGGERPFGPWSSADTTKTRREVGVWGRQTPSPAALRVKAAREQEATRQREEVRIRRASRFLSAKEVRFLEASEHQVPGQRHLRRGEARPLGRARGRAQEGHLMRRLRGPQGAGGAPLPLGLCREPAAMLISCAGASTLEQALRGQRWNEAKAVDVAVQLCRRVDEIHTKGLIHNDLKADNVMLDKALGVSVIDFGTATPEGGVVGYQTDGTFRGEWLAPELLIGGASTRASDAYSVGFLLR